MAELPMKQQICKARFQGGILSSVVGWNKRHHIWENIEHSSEFSDILLYLETRA